MTLHDFRGTKFVQAYALQMQKCVFASPLLLQIRCKNPGSHANDQVLLFISAQVEFPAQSALVWNTFQIPEIELDKEVSVEFECYSFYFYTAGMHFLSTSA